MDQYDYIRTAVKRYGKSIRGVVRETGHARNTVRRALRGKEPGYQMKEPRPCPVLSPVRERINLWLEQDQKVPKKQRHTARRMFERLREEHSYKGSYSVVQRYVRKRKAEMGQQKIEAMVPLDPEVGHRAEMDWGEAHVKLNGEQIKVYLFCMRSVYSGKWFLKAYRRQAQEMFFDGHNQAFKYFGGVFPVIVYDNLKTAVKRVLRGKKREEQDQFILFRSHYGFEARFCTPAKGNEKGGVEGLFSYARKKFMVPLPEIASMDELNDYLKKAAEQDQDRAIQGREDQRTIAEKAHEEVASLHPLVSPKASHKNVSAKVDKYSCVRVDKCRYSVPAEYAGKQAEIELDAEHVRIRIGSHLTSHLRAFSEQWCIDPLHYLGLLRQKVRAFDFAKPIRQWQASWPPSYHLMLERLRRKWGHDEGTRYFIDLLMLHREFESEEVATAMECALEQGVIHADGVKSIILHLKSKQEKPRSLVEEVLPAKCRQVHVSIGSADYGQLQGAMR